MSNKPGIGFEGVEAPPPSYDQVQSRPQVQQPEPSFRLAFQDFFPQCLQSAGFLRAPEFERFTVLIERANQWLLSNPHIEVKQCESLEKKTHMGGTPNPNESVRMDRRTIQYMVRGLRVWFAPRTTGDRPADQLGHINCVPACLRSGGFLHYPEFESIGETLSKFNGYLQQQPLPGYIVGVETQDIKYQNSWTDGCIDPDNSCWYESGKHHTLFLFVIRVFYIRGHPQYEEIGTADFLPELQMSKGGLSAMMGLVKYVEPLHNVIGKANAWIQAQQGIRIVNTQTVDVKMQKNAFSGPVVIDSQRSFFVEYGKGTTCYVRTVRVVFVKPRTPLPPSPPLMLTYRNFVPHQLSSGGMLSVPQFEDQNQTMARMIAWLNATGAIAVGAETIEIKIGESEGDQSMFYYNRGNFNELYLSILRVYLHGVYQEPPPESLPSPAMMASKSKSDCIVM